MFKKRTKSADEIRAEIVDLVSRRDAMLKSAPRSVIFRRALMPVMLVPILAGLIAIGAKGVPSWSHALILLAIFAVFGSATWKVWRPGFDRRDLWDASDRLGYDGDSPREIQRRIDKLEAELRARD